MRLQFLFSEIWIGLRRNLTMTVAVVVTLTLSLTLIGAGLLVRDQVKLMKGYWYDKVEVSVFLCQDFSTNKACKGHNVTPAEMQNISQVLNQNPQVKSPVFFEDHEEAFQNFKTQFKDDPAILRDVTPDVLPESYRVKLKDPDQYAVVASAVEGLPGVDVVQDQKKLLDRVFNVLDRLRLAALVIAAFQLVAAVLLISNTIRVAAFTRRRETGIMRLVGASNTYIRLPFLLEGALAGVVGGALAAGLLALGKYFLVDKVLRPSIQFTAWIGWPAVYRAVPVIFLVGIVLSVAASYVSLRRHLRV